MTTIILEPRELRAACDAIRSEGRVVGFVPTMGALHAGHMSLVEAARAQGATRVVVSIFVNPLQFGPSEDFSRYPRTLPDDQRLCEAHGVDLIYAPNGPSMYPAGFQTHVEVEQITQRFEGASRPTHFRGVTTVVQKLWNAVGPCISCFGRKDYQQWRVLERMARDLDMPVRVVGCPIARDPDGLAMSSRNRYLDPQQRQRALALHGGLCAADRAYRAGERSVAALEALARGPIEHAFDAIDYVSVADAEELTACGPLAERPVVLLLAARVGNTRLIDNAVLGQDVLR